MLVLFILFFIHPLISAILDCISKLPKNNDNDSMMIDINVVDGDTICHENHRNMSIVIGFTIVNP